MIIYLIIALLLLICSFLLFKCWKNISNNDEIWPYLKKKVLSNPEQILYSRLIKALPEYIVLAQVPLSRFIEVRKVNNYQKYFNKISRLSVDYLVCNKDFSVLKAIELDDSSHNNKARKLVDIRKDSAFKAAGIDIIRWRVESLPDEKIIKASILERN